MASSLDKQKRFLATPKFAVVGASTDQSKFGTKVLQWYIQRSFDVTPVHPTNDELEGIKAIRSLSDLPAPKETAISIITPAKITLPLLTLANTLSVPYLWIQPGAADTTCVQYIKDNDMTDRVLWQGECILRDGDDAVRSML